MKNLGNYCLTNIPGISNNINIWRNYKNGILRIIIKADCTEDLEKTLNLFYNWNAYTQEPESIAENTVSLQTSDKRFKRCLFNILENNYSKKYSYIDYYKEEDRPLFNGYLVKKAAKLFENISIS